MSASLIPLSHLVPGKSKDGTLAEQVNAWCPAPLAFDAASSPGS